MDTNGQTGRQAKPICSKCSTPINTFSTSIISITIVNINPGTTQSVFSIQLDLELKVYHEYHSQYHYQSGYNSANLYLSFKKVIQDASCLLTKQQLLSHRNQSRVLFQLTFILNSMIEVNIITSFTSLFTIVIRLIVIQVLRSYLQAHLDLQTMYNVIYLGVFRFTNIGFATIFVTHIIYRDSNIQD